MTTKKRKPQKLDEFLQRLKTKEGEKPTHLRIPDMDRGIYGGSWRITDKADLIKFHKLYYKKVFELGLPEYLTETQDREKGGPVFLDLDFKLLDVEKRQHDSDIVNDLIECYLQHLSVLINLDNWEGEKPFYVWVFEKDDINRLKDKKEIEGGWYDVKDGIHIIFELKMPHDMQMLLRKMVLTSIEDEVFDALRPSLVNSAEDIIDKSVSSGSTGVQMYGSKKPGGEPYKLTGNYKVVFNAATKLFEIEYNATNEMLEKCKENKKLSAFFSTRTKYKNFRSVEISDQLKKTYLEAKEKAEKNKLLKQSNFTQESNNGQFELLYEQGVFGEISTEEELLKYLKVFILDMDNQEIVSTHKYLMILGEEYYDPYDRWFKIGQALQSKSNELMLSWALWSSQSSKWVWDDEPMKMIQTYWASICNMKDKLISVGSIRYWAKKANLSVYTTIYKDSLQYYMDETLFGEGTEYDLARLLFFMFSDKYACTSLKGQGEWWEFNSLLKAEYKHMWTECETGTSLRRKLSSNLSTKYIEEENKVTGAMKDKIRFKDTLESDLSTTHQGDAAKTNLLAEVKKELARITKRGAIYNNIAIKLKKTTNKLKIMQEAKDHFRDCFLLEKLDSDPYKIGFNNGIYDFKNSKWEENNKTVYKGLFRPGYPEDYISKSTKLDYIKYSDSNIDHVKIKEEIDVFMKQLFVDDSLRKYMWDHLASALIGVNKSQTFNIYYGGGSNGKSMLVKFLKTCLGDYCKIDVPLSLITQKRVGVGDTSPEIANLKGIRYAVMQEASKGDIINDGIMKQLTGGDVLTGRHLFKDPISFIPQFTLSLCLNVMPTINSNDGGTWRRIRKVDFESTFVDSRKHKISLVEADKQFPMDRNLEENFERWAPIMVSLLIDIAQRNMGDVEDCEKVLEASKRYREREDYLAQFVNDKIVVTANKEHVISKTGVKGEFKSWWQMNHNGPCPKLTELIDFLDRKYDPLARQIKEYRGWRMRNDLIDEEEDADV